MREVKLFTMTSNESLIRSLLPPEVQASFTGRAGQLLASAILTHLEVQAEIAIGPADVAFERQREADAALESVIKNLTSAASSVVRRKTNEAIKKLARLVAVAIQGAL